MTTRVEVELTYPKPWVSIKFFNKLHFGAKARCMQAYANHFRAQSAHLPTVGNTGQVMLDNVSIVGYRVASRRLDLDNLTASLKPVLDALVAPTSRNPRGIGLIVDDRPSILRTLETHQFRPSEESPEGTTLIITGDLPK